MFFLKQSSREDSISTKRMPLKNRQWQNVGPFLKSQSVRPILVLISWLWTQGCLRLALWRTSLAMALIWGWVPSFHVIWQRPGDEQNLANQLGSSFEFMISYCFIHARWFTKLGFCPPIVHLFWRLLAHLRPSTWLMLCLGQVPSRLDISLALSEPRCWFLNLQKGDQKVG